MELILSITYALFFLFIIGRVRFFRLKEIPVRVLWGGYLIKLMAGIGIGLIYTYYYTDRLTADTFRLFDDSKIIFDSFYTNKTDFFRMFTGIGAGSSELNGYYNAMNNWYDVYSPINDNRTMIRFNAFLRFISMGNYYVHVVVISFLSFTGVVGLVKVFEERFSNLTKDIYLVLIILPSSLLWISGLLKDSLAFFAFGITIYQFNKLLRAEKYSVKGILLLLFFLAALMFSKFQIFLLSLPLLTAWAFAEKTKINAWVIFPSVLSATIVLLFILGYTVPSLDISSMLSAKQAAFYDLGIKENAGSLISIPRLDPEMSSILMNAPGGFLTALVRPLPFDPGPALSKVFTVENLLVIIFILWNIFRGKNDSVSSDPLVVFCLFYAVVYLSVIGMVTPVLGAMVRYKAQALPFLIIWAITVKGKNRQSLTTNRFNKF